MANRRISASFWVIPHTHTQSVVRARTLDKAIVIHHNYPNTTERNEFALLYFQVTINRQRVVSRCLSGWYTSRSYIKGCCHTDYYSSSWQVQAKQERHQVTLKAVIAITKCNRRCLEVVQVLFRLPRPT